MIEESPLLQICQHEHAVIQFVSEAWNEVKATTLRKSWNKILPSAPTDPQCTLASIQAWKGIDKDVYESLPEKMKNQYNPVQ